VPGANNLVSKNNYLMKYWILFGSGALFYYKSRLPFGLLKKGNLFRATGFELRENQ
jgi:hypothetical protein